jgi:Asp-tRNA(Asn)/Glu-tRNA(Gln) amidotransferase A subunit family amidase
LLRGAPAAPTGVEVVTQLAVRDKLRARMLRQMEQVPVILMPVCAVTTWGYRERPVPILEAMSFVTPWNLFGFPALTVPFGFDGDGMPVGVQLVGRPWEEATLLAVGEALEEARGPLAGPDLEWS